MVQINAEGRLKIRAVLVTEKETFYSAWGEIDELGNFVGEQVLYDNGDIRIRLDGIDVFYHANNNVLTTTIPNLTMQKVIKKIKKMRIQISRQKAQKTMDIRAKKSTAI